MNRICVATSSAKTYYVAVSMLKRSGLPFVSLTEDDECETCALVITSAREARRFGDKALVLEDLDSTPGIFKGQLLSRLQAGGEVMLAGVDPGKRIGLAVFYGETSLEYSTFVSVAGLSDRVGAFGRAVRTKRFVVRVGNGSPAVSSRLVEMLKREVDGAVIEVVDEAGTSTKRSGARDVPGDPGSAARIAFRKGESLT